MQWLIKNKMIKIPKSFQLTGHTYKVKLVKKIDSKDSCGEVDNGTKLIKLKKAQKDYTVEMVEESYFHELIHSLLDEAEYPELSKDEKLVERLGRLLHQAI